MGKLVFNNNSDRSGELRRNPEEYFRKSRVVARERATAQVRAERTSSERKANGTSSPSRIRFS